MATQTDTALTDQGKLDIARQELLTLETQRYRAKINPTVAQPTYYGPDGQPLDLDDMIADLAKEVKALEKKVNG